MGVAGISRGYCSESAIDDEPGTGATLTGIVSQQWSWATVHVNAAAVREQHTDYFLDTIIESPHDWAVRLVGEFFYERDVAKSQPRFRRPDRGDLAGQRQYRVRLRLRGARINDHTAGETRAGVTFAFGVSQGPELLSGLSSASLAESH